MRELSPSVMHLQMRGEFDIGNKDSLAALLLPAESAEAVIIDMSGTTYIDSSALHCLVHLRTNLMARNGGSVQLMGLRPNIRRLFSVTGLAGLFGLNHTHAPVDRDI